MSNHRYTSSADVSGHSRAWSTTGQSTERSTTTPSRRPMPQLPASGPSTPITYSPTPAQQQQQYQTYSPLPRASHDGFDYPSRAGSTSTRFLDSNLPPPASPIYKGYNPQDYAQLDRPSPYQSPMPHRTPEYSPATYRPYNPAIYQDPAGRERQFAPHSPLVSQDLNTRFAQQPPPVPPKSPIASPTYSRQAYYALPPEPTIPPPVPMKAYPPAHSRSQSRVLAPTVLSSHLRDHDSAPPAPTTPTALHRNSSAAEIYSFISDLPHSPSMNMPGASSGPHDVGNSRSMGNTAQYDDSEKGSRQYRQQQADSAQFEGIQVGLERSRTTGRHPHARPLPAQPMNNDEIYSQSPIAAEPDEMDDDDDDDDEQEAEERAQEELYQQMFDDLGAAASASGYDDEGRYMQTDEHAMPHRSFRVSSIDDGRARTLSITAHAMDYGDGDDPEADAGIAAMRADEEEALRRRQSQMTHKKKQASMDDYVPVDLSSVGGGADVSLSYDTSRRSFVDDYQDEHNFRSQHRSTSSRGSLAIDGRLIRNSSGASMLSFSGGRTHGLVGSGGGFQDAYDRRLSFDEGDESGFFDDQALPGMSTGDVSPTRAGTISGRPLPPPPEGVSPFIDNGDEWTEPGAMSSGYPFPSAHGFAPAPAFQLNNLVPRSASLLGHPVSPPTKLPDRAKTDAEERKRQQMRTASYDWGNSELDAAQAQTALSSGLNLPILPTGRRFQPSKLTSREFDRCREPWALSSLCSWLRAMADGEIKLREQALSEALTGLFTYKVPNIHIAEAEDLATKAVTEMQDAGVLYREEEWLHIKFGPGEVTGVLYQLTNNGCYARKLHDHDNTGKCYSHFCQRTVKRITLQEQGLERKADWATSYRVTKEQVEDIPKKEIERQNILHEIVMTEHDYLDDLVLLGTLFRNGIRKANPPIITPNRLEPFLEKVFGKVDAVQHANREFLLPQLRYRQKEQGPWVTGFSDIFRDWIRKAKVAYIDYAASFPEASLLMKQEEQKNSMFSSFLEKTRNNSQSRRLGWDNFLKAPITRLQRYGLLLQTVHKNMNENAGPEIANLQLAIEEIRAVTKECDAKVAVQGRKAELVELNSRIVLRDEMKDTVRLDLLNKSRELLLIGDLQRMGKNKVTWLETRGILLDNYLVLAKTVSQRHLAGSSKVQTYDVNKMPINMRLLELDSTDEDPVIKSSVRGVSAIATVPVKPPGTSSLNRSALSGTSGATLTPVSTNTTDNALVRTATPTTPGGTAEKDKILYPFRVKHLGRETYTLYASRAEDRRLWCDKIIEAKTKYAASQFRQNAEPFTLRVVADAAFAHDAWSGHQKTVLIKGTSLWRAIDDVERRYANMTKPSPACRARVNCATTFVQADGRMKTLVGTEYGVYLCESGSVRDWSRVLILQRVTQMAVLEEFNLLVLVADKALIAYHLDVVCPIGGGQPTPLNSFKKAPQKLSGQKDVGFFTVGRLKDRTLIFYKKKEGLQSIIKILEPVLQRASTAALRSSRLGNRPSISTFYGTTETFREYDEFVLPSDCVDISIFTSSIAVATSRGFEILNLDKKSPFPIPDLTAPHTENIRKRLEGLTPLGMFRLSSDEATTAGARMNHYSASTNSYTTTNGDTATEFILVYEQCAVFVNKHGEISRSVHMEFLGKAKAATLISGMLVLVDSDFVEIRDAQSGVLKQIVAGKDVRCLDDGRGGSGLELMGMGMGIKGRTLKIAMQHPEQERYQIVVELVPN